VVIRRNANIGMLAALPSSAKFEPLFIVARVDLMRVLVQVPETDALLVEKGTPANLRFTALPDQEFKGTVARTAGALDPKARTLRVEIDLPNPDGKLMWGMYANVILMPKTGEAKKKE
jgi:membrane fusion protein, multidrug efflux system